MGAAVTAGAAGIATGPAGAEADTRYARMLIGATGGTTGCANSQLLGLPANARWSPESCNIVGGDSQPGVICTGDCTPGFIASGSRQLRCDDVAWSPMQGSTTLTCTGETHALHFAVAAAAASAT
jgi:hypothetical protein